MPEIGAQLDSTDHDSITRELRNELVEHMATAHQALEDAVAVLAQLTSDPIYDVDYAESDRYFGEYLRDARKAIVTARALNPDNH